MDYSTTLAYGINLGGPGTGWKVREAEEGFWTPEWCLEGEHIITGAERVLLKHADLNPEDDELERGVGQGLEFVQYLAPGATNWMLTVWHKTIYPGDIYDVSWPILNHDRIEQEWDARLIEAMDVLGATSESGPAWLISTHMI